MTEEVHHLAAMYALDALDADERATFEGHLSACAECRAEVSSFRETIAEVSVERLTPPARIRDRVLDAIDGTSQVSPVPSDVTNLDDARRRPSNLVVGAVAVAAAVIVAIVGFQFGGSGPSVGETVDAILNSPDAVVHDLAGDVPGSISVAWSESRGELAVIAEGLDHPGSDRVYELWLLDDAGAARSVLFASEGGSDTAVGELTATPSGWGVTIEPAGGTDTATSDVIFVVTF